MDESLYRSSIGSLLYLTVSRLDITYTIGVCACYQADPRESHLRCAKCILKYVMGIVEFEIWYSFNTTICLLDIVTLIGLDVSKTERVPLMDVSFWVIT